jgi:hypothetical protein
MPGREGNHGNVARVSSTRAAVNGPWLSGTGEDLASFAYNTQLYKETIYVLESYLEGVPFETLQEHILF